jgi:signal transduction histidine kinase
MVLMLFDSSSTGSAGMLTRNEFVSCNEMARECIENTKLQYPQIEIKLDTALPDTFCVLTDRLYFFRCLRELLYNAAKFSNGKVVNLYVREAETMVVMVVEDVGPGISVENRERMFDPFAKMDDFTEGLGLGLPLTKRHAKNLGGDLELDTDYLLGCRFVLKLPKE